MRYEHLIDNMVRRWDKYESTMDIVMVVLDQVRNQVLDDDLEIWIEYKEADEYSQDEYELLNKTYKHYLEYIDSMKSDLGTLSLQLTSLAKYD